jgi:dienelactone hydrolase
MRAIVVPLLLLLAGLACAQQPVPFTISKPDGPGPFPAVVMLHDCSGLGPRSSGGPGRWALELVSQGYVVAMPDSFTPRGFAGGICTVPPSQRLQDVTPEQRARDAYWMLGHLRTLPYVDGRRVGVMGGSHGGASTLTAVMGNAQGFGAAVALYPNCSRRRSWQPGRMALPLLILAGEKDDWTPADECRRLAAASPRISLRVYPDAHHSFDNATPVRYVAARINLNSPTGRGATTGGHPEAWAASIREVHAFFGAHLK